MLLGGPVNPRYVEAFSEPFLTMLLEASTAASVKVALVREVTRPAGAVEHHPTLFSL